MPYFTYNDSQIFYREADSQVSGKEDSTPLLIILPGNTASSVCHQGELDYFCKQFHTVALDFPGTGLSSRIAIDPAGWWQVCTESVIALADHLGVQKCMVMGTSGGGVVALRCAVAYPERIQMVVADSCVRRFDPQQLRKEVAGRGRMTDDQVGFWQFAQGDNWKQVIEFDNKVLLSAADQGGDLIGGKLSDIACPVLLTGSLQDSSLPDYELQVQEMADAIPDCRVWNEKAGDHPYMWTRPEQFRQACDEFLSAALLISNPELHIIENPSTNQIEALRKKLIAYNVSHSSIAESRDVLIELRTDKYPADVDSLSGGIKGTIWGTCLEISFLVVDEDHNGLGHGVALLHSLEDYAISQGCTQVVLDTFSFQAPEFYKKHGYTVIGHIPGYPDGGGYYIFRKILSDGKAGACTGACTGAGDSQ